MTYESRSPAGTEQAPPTDASRPSCSHASSRRARCPAVIIRTAERSPFRLQTLLAFPSAVAIAGCVVLTVLLGLGGRGGRFIDRYEADATAAMAAADYVTARVCFERLLQARPSDPNYRYGLEACTNGLSQRAASPAPPAAAGGRH